MTGVDGRWLEGLEEAARSKLPAPVFRYFEHGSGAGRTASEAPGSWPAIRFLPRVLRDVRRVDLATRVIGGELAVPFGVAPTTLQRAAHPDGELAMARATAVAGSLMVVSSNAGTSFDEIRDTGVRWWLQAYLPQQRALAEPLLARAVEAGAEAVVLTVDTPVVATKYDEAPRVWDVIEPSMLRINFADGPDPEAAATKATDLGPDDIAWIRDVTGLPVVVKGVLHPDDARACVAAGASAIWVSNHGGRQLDRAVATADALSDVVRAVRATGDAQVYVDGGVRCALDILAALALGADLVFLGRLPLWALVGGESGVSRMHELLTRDLVEAMRLAGLSTPADAPMIVRQHAKPL
ncbi:alpha-hydroxy acid oxidase [Nocardioides jensenii]|uniref:alpha-hydroxy acid oxidase n=1 Tax=Nocardioides jensenii TaxID=1843 RepID=UPI00082A786E|nr:alpha-hydroxy acid oxidase [Nocardioides jensenii]